MCFTKIGYRWNHPPTSRRLPGIARVGMQDYHARNQCKTCRYGQYTNYLIGGFAQAIKCGLTQEIHLSYAKCNDHEVVLPILSRYTKESGVTQTGELLDLLNNRYIPCKKGRCPDHVKPVEFLSDGW